MPENSKVRRGGKPVPFMMLGWREVVHLHALDLCHIPAKIDTGARTTALHAEGIQTFESTDGVSMVEFSPPVLRMEPRRRVQLPIIDVRPVKNTSGQAMERVVIATDLTIGGRSWEIEVTLADRADMDFPLIIGRQAIRRQRLTVHPGRSFLTHEALQSQAISTEKARR